MGPSILITTRLLHAIFKSQMRNELSAISPKVYVCDHRHRASSLGILSDFIDEKGPDFATGRVPPLETTTQRPTVGPINLQTNLLIGISHKCLSVCLYASVSFLLSFFFLYFFIIILLCRY